MRLRSLILTWGISLVLVHAGPEKVVVKAGETLEFPKLEISRALDLYKAWTGHKVYANAEQQDAQFFFYQPGPLSNQKAADLLKLTLLVEGFEISPDPEIKGGFFLKESDKFAPSPRLKEAARKLVEVAVDDPKEVILAEDDIIEMPRMSGLDAAHLCREYTGKRVITSYVSTLAEFIFIQPGPLTRAEFIKLLHNAVQHGGFGFVPAEGHPDVLLLILTDEKKMLTNRERQKKRKGKRVRLRYVPKPKK